MAGRVNTAEVYATRAATISMPAATHGRGLGVSRALAWYAAIVFAVSRLGFVAVTLVAPRILRLKHGANGSFYGA